MEIELRIWLDDERPMPKDYDMHIRSASETINLLKEGKVDFISFDHDLGNDEDGTGYDVAKFIEEQAFNKQIEPIGWAVHSANPVGRNNIISSMRNADKFWNKS